MEYKQPLIYINAGFRLACRSPLCRFAAWSSLAVSELQLSAATPLWLYHRAASLPSWIEFNCLRSAAVGKAARLSINWLDAAWRCLPLGHPSAASGACAVVQISSSKRQCGKRQVSLKAALPLEAPISGLVAILISGLSAPCRSTKISSSLMATDMILPILPWLLANTPAPPGLDGSRITKKLRDHDRTYDSMYMWRDPNWRSPRDGWAELMIPTSGSTMMLLCGAETSSLYMTVSMTWPSESTLQRRNPGRAEKNLASFGLHTAGMKWAPKFPLLYN